MWVLMKSTYAGPLGLFVKGLKYDLPDATGGRLPKKYFKKTCAPWDEQKDERAVQAAKEAEDAKRIAEQKAKEAGIEQAVEAGPGQPEDPDDAE